MLGRHGCVINGLDFEEYLGTKPNKTQRTGDCKLILVFNTWSIFHSRASDSISWTSLRKKLVIDEQLARCWSESVVKEFWVNFYRNADRIFLKIYILNILYCMCCIAMCTV